MPDQSSPLNAIPDAPDEEKAGALISGWLDSATALAKFLGLWFWLLIVGLFLGLVVGRYVLEAIEPISNSLAILGVAVVANLALSWMEAHRDISTSWSLTLRLGGVILLLGGLMYFNGGVTNPLDLIILAPVAMRASAPNHSHGVALAGLAMAICSYEVFYFHPLITEWNGLPYRMAQGLGLDISIGFSASAVIFAAQQADLHRLSFIALQRVLSREQRLSALGALAASAAHELGTPLATISIIATELARELPEGPNRQDAEQMVVQARRCRDILRRLGRAPEQTDAMHERMSLMQFVRDLIEPWSGREEVRTEALVLGPPGARTPEIWRRPEIAHALAAVVENAFDFAKTHVLVAARSTDAEILVEVRDDGPGFPASILPKLGAPYVTQRPAATTGRSGHTGTGLGLFIAKSLIERSGARILYRNHVDGGAQVIVHWPRSVLEATEEVWSEPAT